MTKAEEICASASADIRPLAITLANAILAMQDKIEQQIPIYERMPLAQQVKVGTGEKVVRQNPAVQEFRATVREYAQALSNLQTLIGAEEIEPKKKAEVIKLVGNSKWKKKA